MPPQYDDDAAIAAFGNGQPYLGLLYSPGWTIGPPCARECLLPAASPPNTIGNVPDYNRDDRPRYKLNITTRYAAAGPMLAVRPRSFQLGCRYLPPRYPETLTNCGVRVTGRHANVTAATSSATYGPFVVSYDSGVDNGRMPPLASRMKRVTLPLDAAGAGLTDLLFEVDQATTQAANKAVVVIEMDNFEYDLVTVTP